MARVEGKRKGGSMQDTTRNKKRDASRTPDNAARKTSDGARGARRVKPKKLTVKDLQAFKAALLKDKERVLKSLDHLEESTSQTLRGSGADTSGVPSHLAELGSDSFEKDLEFNLTSSESLLLAEIEEALSKIERKEFGKCEECGSLIPKARLKAIPFTKFCLTCQKSREKNSAY